MSLSLEKKPKLNVTKFPFVEKNQSLNFCLSRHFLESVRAIKLKLDVVFKQERQNDTHFKIQFTLMASK